MKFEELEEKVINWGAEKGILDKATPLAQCNKTFEEVEELKEALEAQEQGLETFINSKGFLVNTDAQDGWQGLQPTPEFDLKKNPGSPNSLVALKILIKSSYFMKK